VSPQRQIEKLQRFKDYVHDYLDKRGIPRNPPGIHGDFGCRIGDRLDFVFENYHPKVEADIAISVPRRPITDEERQHIEDRIKQRLRDASEDIKQRWCPELSDNVDRGEIPITNALILIERVPKDQQFYYLAMGKVMNSQSFRNYVKTFDFARAYGLPPGKPYTIEKRVHRPMVAIDTENQGLHRELQPPVIVHMDRPG